MGVPGGYSVGGRRRRAAVPMTLAGTRRGCSEAVTRVGLPEGEQLAGGPGPPRDRRGSTSVRFGRRTSPRSGERGFSILSRRRPFERGEDILTFEVRELLE